MASSAALVNSAAAVVYASCRPVRSGRPRWQFGGADFCHCRRRRRACSSSRPRWDRDWRRFLFPWPSWPGGGTCSPRPPSAPSADPVRTPEEEVWWVVRRSRKSHWTCFVVLPRRCRHPAGRCHSVCWRSSPFQPVHLARLAGSAPKARARRKANAHMGVRTKVPFYTNNPSKNTPAMPKLTNLVVTLFE